ncbi:MAG: hypothetical protein ISS81_09800 [Candidatus Marinimicrobia bacterium]|nr:hypothetical protein [Candidatus Neomarinimicrobiota bacterium]
MRKEIVCLLLLFLITPYFLIANNGVNTDINLYILSFDNLSEDPEIDWLKDGFTDFIINHYNYVKGVTANRTIVLENILKEIRVKPELKRKNNIILSGSYKRDKGKFFIKIQLTDLNTLETIASKEIKENSSDLGKVMELVNNTIDEMIIPGYQIHPREGVLSLVKPKTKEEEKNLKRGSDEIQRVSVISQATKNISFALDKLERSYTNKSLIGEEKKYYKQTDISRQKISSDQFSRKISDHFSQTKSFKEIIYRIAQNPYEIEITDPTFKRVPLFPDKIEVRFSVNFRLHRDIIKDMLETLPCTKRKVDDFIEYSYSGDQFIFDECLIDEISRGIFRSFPIIIFSSEKGDCVFNLIDVPFTFQPQNEGRLNLLFNNQFRPMFNIYSSASDVKVYLQNRGTEVEYKIQISIEQLSKISQISVRMFSEDEISKFMSSN